MKLIGFIIIRTLQEIKASGEPEKYDVPGATVAQDFALYEAPKQGDL